MKFRPEAGRAPRDASRPGAVSLHWPRRRAAVVATAAAVGLAVAVPAVPAYAADAAFPARPVTMLLPLATGSAGDVALRVVAQKLAENIGQSVVVENLPGVSGLLGSEKLARATPDGYLIGGLGDSILNYAAQLTPTKFDPVDGFEPVALVATIPWVLAINPAYGPKTLAEFIDKARAEPGRVDYGSTGPGSASHVAMELLSAKADIRMNHVPFKGTTPAVNDTIGGHVAAVFSAVSVVLPHLQSGRLLALGVPMAQRSPWLPQTPTFAEAGLPGLEFVTWVALFAPKGTPKPVITYLNTQVGRTLADPAVRERLETLGLEPRASTPEELGEMVRAGHARVGAILRQTGLKAP